MGAIALALYFTPFFAYNGIKGGDSLQIYMDVCCLNCPFDDLTQAKVYLEAEAIMSIVSHCERGMGTLVTSSVINYEISRTVDISRMEQVQNLCTVALKYVIMTAEDERRAKHFQQNGIKPMDSFHLAVAESNKADVFLTTDRKLLNAANRLGLKLKIANPVAWFMEVMDNE